MVQENCLKKIVVVCGPTGSGKTATAVNLAKQFDGEVISADSVAIYKYLDIGSAKPSKEEMNGIPHHMIDIISPFDSFSVSDYEIEATKSLTDIFGRGKLPIICGGTGFYINSLLYKLSYGKHSANHEVREKYETILKNHGNMFLHDILRSVDPETADKLHPNDTVRVIRALEIFESTGIKKSDIKDDFVPKYDFIAIMPDFERSVLYERINKRVDNMFSKGLESEVKNLIDMGVTRDNQSMQAIGYRETLDALLSNKEIPIEEIKTNSRRYAKRQLTFFRQYKNLIPICADEEYMQNALKVVDNFLNNKII